MATISPLVPTLPPSPAVRSPEPIGLPRLSVASVVQAEEAEAASRRTAELVPTVPVSARKMRRGSSWVPEPPPSAQSARRPATQQTGRGRMRGSVVKVNSPIEAPGSGTHQMARSSSINLFLGGMRRSTVKGASLPTADEANLRFFGPQGRKRQQSTTRASVELLRETDGNSPAMSNFSGSMIEAEPVKAIAIATQEDVALFEHRNQLDLEDDEDEENGGTLKSRISPSTMKTMAFMRSATKRVAGKAKANAAKNVPYRNLSLTATQAAQIYDTELKVTESGNYLREDKPPGSPRGRRISSFARNSGLGGEDNNFGGKVTFQRLRGGKSNLMVALSANPITGLLSGIPLHKIWRTFFLRKPVRVAPIRGARSTYTGNEDAEENQNQLKALGFPVPTKQLGPLSSITFARDRMSLSAFGAYLRQLVPGVTLSETYLDRMYTPFVPYFGGGFSDYRRIYYSDVFDYLCRCNGSPQVERNVKFLFECMDDSKTEAIFCASLSPQVLRSFVENRVVGNPIHAWRDVVASLEADFPSVLIEKRKMDPWATLTLDELRVLVYASQPLTEAFDAAELECVLTDAPRFPIAPPEDFTPRFPQITPPSTSANNNGGALSPSNQLSDSTVM